MVDAKYRLEMADAIDSYLHDAIDNHELDDVLNNRSTNDLACTEIAAEMSRFIDDFKKHYYSDAKLASDYKRGVERWVVFLRTSNEWPLPACPRENVLKVLLSIFRRRESTPFTRNPFWPYANEFDWNVVLVTVHGKTSS